MLDADGRPDDTLPATGADATGADATGRNATGRNATGRNATARHATGWRAAAGYASRRASQSRWAATAARDIAACGTEPAKPWKPPGHTCSSAEPPACQIPLA
jgi:hypothetical protein